MALWFVEQRLREVDRLRRFHRGYCCKRWNPCGCGWGGRTSHSLKNRETISIRDQDLLNRFIVLRRIWSVSVRERILISSSLRQCWWSPDFMTLKKPRCGKKSKWWTIIYCCCCSFPKVEQCSQFVHCVEKGPGSRRWPLPDTTNLH